MNSICIVWGMSVPWTLGLSTLLGIGLVFAPALFGVDTEATVADLFHLYGSLIVVISVICWGEIVRMGRHLNILHTLALIIGPWLIDGVGAGLALTGTVLGIIIVALAFPVGPIREKYGLWDNMLHKAMAVKPVGEWRSNKVAIETIASNGVKNVCERGNTLPEVLFPFGTYESKYGHRGIQ